MFRIYYGDGSVYEGVEPESIPHDKRENIQCIVSPDLRKGPQNIGRYVWRGWDYYLYSDRVGGWHTTNRVSDLLYHLRDQGLGKGGVRAVLVGGWVSNGTFDEIRKRAESDEGFSPKSADAQYPEDGRDT